MKAEKNQQWIFNREIDFEACGAGVQRKILSYADELMCVENHFETGAVGALHSHPHTQISYVVSGSFEYENNGVRKRVDAGDTILMLDGVVHGLICLEQGIVLDIFTPMRQDFI